MSDPVIKRIVIASDDAGHLGGVTSAIQTLGDGFRSKGIHVEYMSLHTPDLKHAPLAPIFEANRYEFTPANHPLAKDYPGPFGLRLAAKRAATLMWTQYRNARLRRFLNRLQDSDAIISAKPQIGILIESELTRRRRATGGAPFHAHQIHYSFEHWYRPRENSNVQHIAEGCDALVALWPSEAIKFGVEHGATTIAIPNAIGDIPPSTSNSTPPSRIVSYITRFSSDKRIELAVQAFDAVLDQVPGWTLHIHGAGPARESIASTIRNSRHPESFHLGEHLSHDGVIAQLRSSELSLLTSVSEGLPMSILEAASLGVPTVATPSAQSVVDITSANGYLCEDDSPEAIAATLQWAMLDAEDRKEKSQRCLEFSQQFTVDSVVDQWLDLLSSRTHQAS